MKKKWLLLLPLMATAMLFSISPNIEASTLNYNVVFIDGENYSPINGGIMTNSDHQRTDKIQIVNNSIILTQKVFAIHFWNNNTLIGHRSVYNDGTWGSNWLGTFPEINNIIIPQNATHFALSGYTGLDNNTTFSQFQNITISYENPEPTFQTDSITYNYVPTTDELTVTLTSLQPTYDSANITARGILYGDSRFYNSASELTVDNALSINPKTDGFGGTQTINLTNSDRGSTLYMRTYVVYNNSTNYYSDGVEVTPPNYNVRQLDYIDHNGQVIYTVNAPINSDASDYDLTAQNSIVGREGYRFLGWTGDDTIDTDLRIYERTAQWEQVITYDVTFTDYDDSIIEVVTVEQGQTAIPTQTPTRTGYIFAYWEPPVTDIQGNLTTKAIYYIVITWRGLNDELIRIDNVLENEPLSPPARAGYVRVWNSPATAIVPATYTLQSETIEQNSGVTESGVTESGTTIFRTQLPDDYSGITDLFGGVFGAIVGTIMILGTIDLFGVELSSLFWLFFAGSGFFMIWRFVR